MRAALLGCLLAGCVGTNAIGDHEVITVLDLHATEGHALVADGATRAEVQVCVTDEQGRDPALSATLKATDGAWKPSDASDSKSVTVAMKSPCETWALALPTTPGPLTVTAMIDGFTLSTTKDVSAAPVTRVRLGVNGALSSAASSAIMLKATLDVSPDGTGAPSTGTPVIFTATAQPAGAIGYLSDVTVTVSGGGAVQTTYTASAAVTSVSFTATAQPVDQPPVTSDSVLVAR